MSKVILSIAYLPPVQYFAKIFQYPNVFIETAENYTKQTYRNRCVILGANGPLALTIPVIKTQGNHTPIKLVEIDNSTLWQKNHWKAIESAYRTSAYFEFLADVLQPYYTHRYSNLFEFDSLLLNSIFEFISASPRIIHTANYQPSYDSDVLDCRNEISPKVDYRVDRQFLPVEYFQTFSNKYGFVPNLSIIDLLFNEGLSAIEIIDASLKRPVE